MCAPSRHSILAPCGWLAALVRAVLVSLALLLAVSQFSASVAAAASEPASTPHRPTAAPA